MSLALVALLLLPQDPPRKPGETRSMDRAVDSIARHITRAGGRIAICWVIDASPSMTDDRAAVAKKIDVIFDGLPKSASLTMSVIGFDDKATTYLSLGDRREDVRAALAKVGTKGSGKENVFGTVEAASRLIHGEGQTLAVILVTDEAGDDAERAERALERVKEEGIQVHAIGREARFGWTQSYEHDGRWWVPVLAGPESAAQEVMHCCYQEAWPRCIKRLVDAGVEVKNFQHEDPLGCCLGAGPMLTAGFGPRALERLARESGGSYTILGEKPTYDPKSMEGYEPELCSLEDWRERNRKSALRRALIAMFEERLKARDMGLRAEFSKGEAEAIAARTKKAEEQVDKWIAMLEKARKDAGEPTTQKPYKCWHANVDLAIAQLRALAHYLEQYRLLMVDLSSGKRTVGPHPLFLVQGERRGGKRFEPALEACLAVDKAHPGTPWAWCARWIGGRLGGVDVVEQKPPTGPQPNPNPRTEPPPDPGPK